MPLGHCEGDEEDGERWRDRHLHPKLSPCLILQGNIQKRALLLKDALRWKIAAIIKEQRHL